MSGTNQPEDHRGRQDHPGAAHPVDGTESYGYGDGQPAPPPSPGPFGAAVPGPVHGSPAASPSPGPFGAAAPGPVPGPPVGLPTSPQVGLPTSPPVELPTSPPVELPASPPVGPPTGPPAGPVSAPSAAPGAQTLSAAPGAQALSAAQAGAALRRFGIGNPLPTFVVGGLAYVVALCAALLVIVSAIIAALAVDTGGLPSGASAPTTGPVAPSGDGGWELLVGLVGIPFQLVSLASFGSYEMTLRMGFLGNATMGWRGLPLVITVAMAGTAFLAARFAQRRWGSNGMLGAVLWSGISGLAVAIFAVIATRLTAFAAEDDTLGMSLSMHSAGIDMFFGTWALIALPLLLGHIAGMQKPSWWPLVADLAAAPRLVLVHALGFALPVFVLMAGGGAIAMALDGEGRTALVLFLALPIWGLNALALLPGLGMLAVPMHVNLRGDVEGLGVDRTDEFLWFFDLPWYGWIPMVLIALLAPILVALLWNRDREIVRGNILGLAASWIALPLAYVACSVALLALVWTGAHARMGMLGQITVNVSLALWMPLVAFVIGALVEVLARFGAPFVDRFLPGVLVNWFRRSARARRTDGHALGTDQGRGPEQMPPGPPPGAPILPRW